MTTTSASVLLNRLQARGRLRHLQVLVRLAELGNLKRCAESIGLSQPAVTQLLADLERLVEVPLFERHSRGVRITAAGDALLPLARRMLDTLADGSETITALKRQGEGTVRVAAITGAVSGLLARAMPILAREQPRIQVHVREADVDQCSLLLARREVDLAACREPAALPQGCRFIPLVEDHFVVVCAPGHPLARRRAVTWSTLARERWLLSPVDSAARRIFDQRMAELGVEPAVSPVITRVSALTWAMLQADRLLTLVPFGVVRQLVEARQLAVVDARPALAFAPIGLVAPQQGATEAANSVVNFLQDFVRRPA
jgi:DNA-binding transcriptional LysR family regulator